MAMGNNPISMVDPDGAFSKFGAWWRNGFSMEGVYESGGEWGFDRHYIDYSNADMSAGMLPELINEFHFSDALSGMEGLHTALDAGGMVPGIGEFADGANAFLYALEGDFGNASVSMAAMIPIGGQAATGVRLANKAHTVYTGVKGGEKYIGITSNLKKRYTNDERRTMGISVLLEGVPGRNLARGIEQSLINHHGLKNLSNEINSISEINQKGKHMGTMQDAKNYLDKKLPGWDN